MWDMISMILSTWDVMRIEDATNNNWKTFYEPFINKIWWLDAKLEFVKCQNEWIDTTKKKKKKKKKNFKKKKKKMPPPTPKPPQG